MVLAKAILMIFVKLYTFLIIESIYVMMKLYGPVETQTHDLCLWRALCFTTELQVHIGQVGKISYIVRLSLYSASVKNTINITCFLIIN